MLLKLKKLRKGKYVFFRNEFHFEDDLMYKKMKNLRRKVWRKNQALCDKSKSVIKLRMKVSSDEELMSTLNSSKISKSSSVVSRVTSVQERRLSSISE